MAKWVLDDGRIWFPARGRYITGEEWRQLCLELGKRRWSRADKARLRKKWGVAHG